MLHSAESRPQAPSGYHLSKDNPKGLERRPELGRSSRQTPALPGARFEKNHHTGFDSAHAAHSYPKLQRKVGHEWALGKLHEPSSSESVELATLHRQPAQVFVSLKARP